MLQNALSVITSSEDNLIDAEDKFMRNPSIAVSVVFR